MPVQPHGMSAASRGREIDPGPPLPAARDFDATAGGTWRGPAAQAVSVPHGIESLADVFLEKARAEPIEVVDFAGHHWLLSWSGQPEPQVSVHALERRSVVPTLAEVTAHDLAALLAWALEPRPASPLQPVPDRVWRLLGLDHPLAAAVRRSRADVLPLRAHGLPDGFAMEAARADLRLFVQDHRRPQGDDLLQIVLWCWSSRGVWPPMRRAIPPGDLPLRLVLETPPLRQVEELAALLRRLARMPGSQLWSARELDELRGVLAAFDLPLPPVELVDVDRDGVVTLLWRGDRLVASMPPGDRMSEFEREASARMLDGLLPPPLLERLHPTTSPAADESPTAVLAWPPRAAAASGHGAGRAVSPAEGRAAPAADDLPSSLSSPALGARPTTRRSAAASPSGNDARSVDSPVAPDLRSPTPSDDQRRRPTPLAVPAPAPAERAAQSTDAVRQMGIGATRRDAKATSQGAQPGATTALPPAAAHYTRASTPSHQPSSAAAAASYAVASEPAHGGASFTTDDWMRGSVTPASTVAEPSDLRAMLSLQPTAAQPAPRTFVLPELRLGLPAWTFAAGLLLGLAVGWMLGDSSEPPAATPAPGAIAKGADRQSASGKPDRGPAAPGEAAAGQELAEAAEGDAPPTPAPTLAAGAADPSAEDQRADEPEAAALAAAPAAVEPSAAAAAVPNPAAPAAAGLAGALPVGPGFAALQPVSLWDGNSAPWAEPGVRVRCNAYGDLELSKGGEERVVVCGPFYNDGGHLVRYAACAEKPARCAMLQPSLRGARPVVCTPRSARPLVRVQRNPGDPDRYSSDIALRRLFDRGNRGTEPLCPEPARYWSKMERRWMDAGPPPGQAPALNSRAGDGGD